MSSRRKFLKDLASLIAGLGISSPLKTIAESANQPEAKTSTLSEKSVQVKKVALFAGHTENASSKGAVSSSGIREYQYNDDIVNLVATLEGEGIDYLPVFAGENVHFSKRPKMARRMGADLYLEVHHDSMFPQYLESLRKTSDDNPEWNTFTGFSTFYSGNNDFAENSLRFAQLLGEEFNEFMQVAAYHASHENLNLVDRERGIYKRDLSVTKYAKIPTVLLECGVITNPNEEKIISSEKGKLRIATAIDTAVRAYFSK